MNIVAFTINHHTAPVEFREALHLSQDEIKTLNSQLKENHFKEGLFLSTCNRTEFYGIPSGNGTDFNFIKDYLVKYKNLPNVKEEYFKQLHSYDALEHLFSVISGIDSQIVGDNQIFSQVKDSFLLSEDSKFTGFLFKRIFDAATRAGKRAINETSINEGAVTISYAAVQLIEKIYSGLSKKSAIVIGAGETGELAAKHLKERGIGKLSITNRTNERAESLASKINASVLPYDEFKNNLHNFDIVISATSAPGFILTKDDVSKAMKKRNYSAMILMDIAVPRDIDPATKDIDYVFYNDIDSLNIIVEQNKKKREEEIPKVKDIINQELSDFINWYKSLEAAPTIKSLRDLFESVRSEEVQKNINRFNDDDKEKVEIITKRIINKLLHHPTVELKKLVNGEASPEDALDKINAIRSLFGIQNDNNKEQN